MSMPPPSASCITSEVTLPDAGDAATFSGTSVAFSRAQSSHQTGTHHSTQQSVLHDVIDAAVDRRLLLATTARREKIPDLKLRTFNGTLAQWQNFHRQLCTHLENPAFSPGGEDLITTPANQAASSRVRTMLLLALTDSAAHRFDCNPKFEKKSFEMVAELRKAHVPTSGSAVMDNFCALHQCEMKSGDTVESYMARLRRTVSLLRAGNAEVNHNLVLLCVIRGLDARYQSAKDDLKINADKYQDMILKKLADVCNAFKSLSTSISTNAATPAASGATTTPPVAVPNSRPTNEEIKARLAAADTVCPHCLIRHPYIDCKKCLAAGFIIEHNPEKAKKKLTELNSKHNNKKKSGKTPSASRAAAPPPAPPPALVPQASPSPPPPSPPLLQTPAENEVATEVPVEIEEDEDASVLAAAVYTVMSATDTLSDDEGSLVEHDGIPPQPKDLPTDSDNLAYAITLYNTSSTAPPAACASASHVPQDLLLDTSPMIGPSQCRNKGRPVESNGEGLIVRMVSTRCMLPCNQNPVTPFGFPGVVSEDTVGNVDPNLSPSFRTGTLHTIMEDCPVCYEGSGIHAVAVPLTYPDHALPFSQDRRSTPISDTPVILGTSPPGARVPTQEGSILSSPSS